MSAFTELLADPFAEKSFIVTVRPCADISGSIAAAGGTNAYTGAPGTFSGLIHGDRLLASGFSIFGNNGYVLVASVADDGSSIVVTGLVLTTESAGARRLYGEVARYYSTHGLTTSPSETPANTWYDGRVENALRFTRSLVSARSSYRTSTARWIRCGAGAGPGARSSSRWAGRSLPDRPMASSSTV